MDQEQFSSPQDSLQLIESMINKAQNRFNENGHLYLLWGWVIFVCSISHFIVDYWNLFSNPQMVWFLTWGALIYQTIYIARRKKKERVRTYTDDIVGWVWVVFVILMALVGFIAGKGNTWQLMYPLFLVLYGVPTFLTGVIIKFQPLQVGAIRLLDTGSCFNLCACSIPGIVPHISCFIGLDYSRIPASFTV
ncbi:MAG: hypothetical protein IPK31_10800 [Chitinophagaceae bacterium]|nr:hypothetical protein [Chitinophagaceae bacterium]